MASFQRQRRRTTKKKQIRVLERPRETVMMAERREIQSCGSGGSSNRRRRRDRDDGGCRCDREWWQRRHNVDDGRDWNKENEHCSKSVGGMGTRRVERSERSYQNSPTDASSRPANTPDPRSSKSTHIPQQND
ncbi:hypothetical protein PIB30_060652 [Stylosanthes scabra]|uniref:Uncharacterized protein n=1 Tax=Stylosanthes scabra TaxID=79078 RepID=A0ABU6UMQ7_9FABA|nr:hypothetical protein [Stylosanthes scabra]